MGKKLGARSMGRFINYVAVLGLLLLSVVSAEAKITRIEILRSEPAFGGASFGDAGTYQHIFARAYGEVDPAAPENAIIQDIDLAPRNTRGMVEYSTDVEFLKPADIGRGNRMLLFEVVNRGNKLAIGSFDNGVPPVPADKNALTSAGDGFLMREGFSLVWWGWEMDVNPGASRVRMPPIVAHNPDGSAVTGVVRTEMTAPRATTTLALSQSWQVVTYPADSYASYPTASTDNKDATLTVRAGPREPRVPIANSEWQFATCPDPAKPEVDDRHVCYPAGFQPGHLYELVYRARDPFVLGLGFVATRDLGDFLRNRPADDAGNANPVWRADQRAILEGSSQSGRMLRSFLALGFNRAEGGRAVFDGAYPHIGGGLMPLNVRFGQPVRAWGEATDNTYPAYDFPFSYARQQDPLTGREQGLLDRCTASGTCPKIFHVATVLEMWEGRQSLGFTDPLGRVDVPDPPAVRTYIMASTQHSPAPLPLPAQPAVCQQQSNPNPQSWTMRALLSDFTAWVRDGVAPPDGVVPRIADGTLVAPDQVRIPPIPATTYNETARPALSLEHLYDPLHVLEFGPGYRPGDTSGVISIEPPRVGSASYGVLEPQVDADGNDIGGVRSVFVQVPIGTYTGWNLFKPALFNAGMCNLQGSFLPFAATKAEREAAGDPRLSLEERYPSKAVYVADVRAAAERLVSARLLLAEDAALLVGEAEREGVRTAP
jgi:hypothetical protein